MVGHVSKHSRTGMRPFRIFAAVVPVGPGIEMIRLLIMATKVLRSEITCLSQSWGIVGEDGSLVPGAGCLCES